MDEESAREELRRKLIEAEIALKEAEEAYVIYMKQVETYKKAIEEQKNVILNIKSSLSNPTYLN
ncbi:hypothetical protein SAMN03159341_104217 [Paenibacillus sp. 1_12]|uniref:hypothetical protein n=1 Tax=Paenibacillus sp. 1_12 TaxID=1566278 RepID=UPI0008E7E7B3|nr:hypothetical protein [Paenibacillus sp. 1_12]SFL24349.1 hypothetical protein SAMN03159341_104217 [Paenibacillus sp. 1_12]